MIHVTQNAIDEFLTQFCQDVIEIDEKLTRFLIIKIAIRRSQKINSRIHNSRIAIRQRIAQLGNI